MRGGLFGIIELGLFGLDCGGIVKVGRWVGAEGGFRSVCGCFVGWLLVEECMIEWMILTWRGKKGRCRSFMID